MSERNEMASQWRKQHSPFVTGGQGNQEVDKVAYERRMDILDEMGFIEPEQMWLLGQYMQMYMAVEQAIGFQLMSYGEDRKGLPVPDEQITLQDRYREILRRLGKGNDYLVLLIRPIDPDEDIEALRFGLVQIFPRIQTALKHLSMIFEGWD